MITPFTAEAKPVEDMYKYVTKPVASLPERSDITFVFGRKSEPLIRAVIRAALLSRFLVVSGNVGKDSGDLPWKPQAEADYIINGAVSAGAIALANTRKDLKAQNGVDNARNGLAIMKNELLLPGADTVTMVMHPTQARRLGATFMRQAQLAEFPINNLVHYASDYEFDPLYLYDQAEVAAEVIRLHDFSDPEKEGGSFFDRPLDLDPEMLAYAREMDAYYAQQFAEQGILNPSTADNTFRDRPILMAPLLVS